ncbi:MAG TPA: YraN family protein [Terriglobales bacterium]|nr:YraN family protein [Terriglobales bacterium]
MFARLIFTAVNFAARNGLTEDSASAKSQSRSTGIRGETYAYWYLRRHGYTLVARNYTVPGIKGEIDMIGYDGPALAFVEVKTRSSSIAESTPEDAVNADKRRNLSRMARQFLRSRRIDSANCRFDVLAIESRAGKKPVVRLHKSAFGMAPTSP